MANKSTTPNFRFDSQTAIRAAIYGAVGYVLFIIVLGIIPGLYGMWQLVYLIPGVVGYFYTAEISKKITPSYVDAAGGGAIAGGIAAAIGAIAASIVGGLFAGSFGDLGSAAFALGFGAFGGSILANLIFMGLLVGAIGGAAYLFLKSSKIT